MPEDKNTLSTPDIQKLLQEYQTGMASIAGMDIPKIGSISNQTIKTPEGEDTGLPVLPTYSERMKNTPLGGYVGEDFTEQARQAGYGLSRYDTDFDPGMDIEDARAREQSSFAKIGSGLMKGGVTAVATAVNTTIGTVFGLGQALFELAADTNDNGRSVMDTLDAGVNNWLSNQLVKLQELSEEWFPNYRTAEERSEKYQREWYKHMGTANFIGDSFLKNFGFTVGAMAGGMAWSKLIGAGLSKQLANNIMKGAVAAAEGDAEAGALLKEAADAILAGERKAAGEAIAGAVERAGALQKAATAAVNTDKVVKNVQTAARALNKYGAKLGLYGAVVGAMGEGTVEGIMSKNEFMQDYENRLQAQFRNEYDNIEEDVLNSGNWSWLTINSIQGPDGKLSGQRELSEEGKREVARRQQSVISKYQNLMQQADVEGDRLASTTYLLNLPILTTSNVVQFGRMLSGGWTTAKNTAASTLRGGLSTSFGENGVAKTVADYASKFGKGAVAGRTVLGALKNAGAEAWEEMAQGTVSSGSKQVADSNLTAFNDAGYDANAIGSVRDWFTGMYQGGKEYLGDVKNWQEGALGAITGLFGIPGRRWNGGVAEAYRSARDEVNASREAANKLNGVVNSEEFQTKWNNYIRHLAFDNEMDEALQENDKYTWKSASDAQLINDIMMFADVGKLDDLKQMVTAMGNMTEEQAAEILSMSKDADGELPAHLKNLNEADMVAKVKEQANDINKKIDEYKEFYDALSTRIPLGTPKDQRERLLKEMTFTAQQIKSFEERYLSLLDKTVEALEPITSSEQEAVREPLKAAIRRAFSGGFPIVLEDAESMQAEYELLNSLEHSAAQSKNEELIQGVADMRKLSKDRRDFYRKLMFLQTEEGQQQFNDKAATQDKINQAAEDAAVREETKEFKSVSDVRHAYNNLKGRDEKTSFVNDLRSKKGANKAIDDFIELHDSVDGFRTKAMAAMEDYLDDNATSPISRSWLQSIYGSMVRDLLYHNVNSIEDLQRLDPDAFASSLDMARTVNENISFGSVSEAVVASKMAEIQEHLRDVMEEYFKEKNSATIARSGKKISMSEKKGGKKRAAPTIKRAKIEKEPEEERPFPSPLKKEKIEPEVVEEFALEEDRTKDKGEGRGSDSRPTKSDLNDIAIPPIPESPAVEDAEKLIDGKRRYYRGSNPEVSTDRQKIRRSAFEKEDTAERDAILASADAQLVEFGEDKGITGKPMPKDKAGEGEVNNFSKITRALKKHHAFDNRSLVRKGDKVKFVIFENEDVETGGFPKIDGKYVILMCVEKVVGGEKKLLVLDSFLDDTESNAQKYFGLSALHEKIREEFADEEKGGFNDKGIFVFSKSSPVWALRSGFMEYGPTNDDHPITGLPGYDKKAPIVFIDSDGEVNYLINEPSGDVNDKKFGHYKELFPNGRLADLEGNFYYLAYDNDGYKVPIRLGQEHFKQETKTNTTAPFVRLREAVSKIVTTVQNAEKEIPSIEPIPGESSEDRKKRVRKHDNILGRYRKELAGHIKELDQILDLHSDAITLGFNADDGKLSLKITPDYFSGSSSEEQKTKQTGRKAMYFYGEDLSVESVLSGLAALDRPFHVSKNESEQSIQRKVNEGILTTNALKMRQVGIDFYIFPWFDSANAFKSGSTKQTKVQKSEYDEPATPTETPKDSTPAASKPGGRAGKFKRGQMGQIVGTRPSAISAETRARIEESRKDSKRRRAKVKSELYNMLQKANSVSNMKMNDKKLKEKLKHLGISAPVIDFIMTGVQQHPELRSMTPYEAFMELDSMMRYDIADEYNRSLGQKLDKGLNDYLRSFLSRYGIKVMEEDLDSMFEQDGIAGVYDIVEKIVWLSNNPDKINKITLPEEFAHAFVELMGSSIGYGADSEDFQFLYETVSNTKIYEQVYEKYKDVYLDEDGKPDEYKIRKEAIGQALATAIVHNWEQVEDKKENTSFFAKLKEWFQKIIDLFKGANITFEQTIDDISKEILAGDTRRLDKIDDNEYRLLDYGETLANQTRQDGGKALEFMRYFSSIGNLITGSLAYRRQGTVYRSKMDSLHDIDMIVPPDVHGIHNVGVLQKYDYRTRNNQDFVNEILSSPYFEKVKKQYPKIVFSSVFNDGNDIVVSAVYSDNEELSHRFSRMTGSYSDRLAQFTDDERKQIYLFDFFLREAGINDTAIFDQENDLNLSGYQNAFRNKLKMGRAKDIYDYQRWRLFEDFQERRPDPRDLLYQVTSVDYGQEALNQHKEQVLSEVSSTSGIFEEDGDNIATALTVIASAGPDVISRAQLALDHWSRPGMTLSQDADDFMLILNSIFTETEKRGIGDALSSAYGVPVEQIDMLRLIQDYTLWKLSGIIMNGTEQDKAVIRDAFGRLQSIETSHEEAASLLPRVSDIVATRRNRNEEFHIGMVPDISIFANLSEETKNGLLARKWTEEEYNAAPEEIQDKAVRCIGV